MTVTVRCVKCDSGVGDGDCEVGDGDSEGSDSVSVHLCVGTSQLLCCLGDEQQRRSEFVNDSLLVT